MSVQPRCCFHNSSRADHKGKGLVAKTMGNRIDRRYIPVIIAAYAIYILLVLLYPGLNDGACSAASDFSIPMKRATQAAFACWLG